MNIKKIGGTLNNEVRTKLGCYLGADPKTQDSKMKMVVKFS
jgi:hypothetical protein